MDDFPENPVEYIKKAQEVETMINEIAKVLKCKPEDIMKKLDKIESRAKELERKLNVIRIRNGND